MVVDDAAALGVGEHAAHAGAARGRAQLAPQRRDPSACSRGMRRLRSPTKSSSTIASASAYPGAATLLPRRPRCSNCASGVPRGLSSPSKATNTTVGRMRRGLIVRASRGEDRRARRAVVGAHEAREVLRVVVGARPPPCATVAAAHHAHHVAQPARHGLEATARERPADPLGQPPRGAPSRPAAGRAPPAGAPRRSAARPSKRFSLALGHGRGSAARRRPRRTARCRWPRATIRVHAEHDLHGEHGEQRLHVAALWQ